MGKKGLERLSSSQTDKSHSVREGHMTQLMSSPSNSLALLQGTVSPTSKNAPVKRAISSPTRTEFEVGDVVKVERESKPWYGVIRYIGDNPNPKVSSRCAGIEMVCNLKPTLFYLHTSLICIRAVVATSLSKLSIACLYTLAKFKCP